MKTIILDIDGTLTDMWPIERSVLTYILGDDSRSIVEELRAYGFNDTYKIFSRLAKKQITKSSYYKLYNKTFKVLQEQGKLPKLEKYRLVDWVLANKRKYHFVYVTGGQKAETRYVLDQIGISNCLDFESSLDKSNYRFSKKTGLPFIKIKSEFSDCILITDSDSDVKGAIKAGVKYLKVAPNANTESIITGLSCILID